MRLSEPLLSFGNQAASGKSQLIRLNHLGLKKLNLTLIFAICLGLGAAQKRLSTKDIP
jgi:hypothetical protein